MYNSNFEVILNVFAYFCDLNCLFPLGDKNRGRMLGKTIFTSQARQKKGQVKTDNDNLSEYKQREFKR